MMVPVGHLGERTIGSVSFEASIDTGPIAGKVSDSFDVHFPPE